MRKRELRRFAKSNTSFRVRWPLYLNTSSARKARKLPSVWKQNVIQVSTRQAIYRQILGTTQTPNRVRSVHPSCHIFHRIWNNRSLRLRPPVGGIRPWMMPLKLAGITINARPTRLNSSSLTWIRLQSTSSRQSLTISLLLRLSLRWSRRPSNLPLCMTSPSTASQE